MSDSPLKSLLRGLRTIPEGGRGGKQGAEARLTIAQTLQAGIIYFLVCWAEAIDPPSACRGESRWCVKLWSRARAKRRRRVILLGGPLHVVGDPMAGYDLCCERRRRGCLLCVHRGFKRLRGCQVVLSSPILLQASLRLGDGPVIAVCQLPPTAGYPEKQIVRPVGAAIFPNCSREVGI